MDEETARLLGEIRDRLAGLQTQLDAAIDALPPWMRHKIRGAIHARTARAAPPGDPGTADRLAG